MKHWWMVRGTSASGDFTRRSVSHTATLSALHAGARFARLCIRLSFQKILLEYCHDDLLEARGILIKSRRSNDALGPAGRQSLSKRATMRRHMGAPLTFILTVDSSRPATCDESRSSDEASCANYTPTSSRERVSNLDYIVIVRGTVDCNVLESRNPSVLKLGSSAL